MRQAESSYMTIDDTPEASTATSLQNQSVSSHEPALEEEEEKKEDSDLKESIIEDQPT